MATKDVAVAWLAQEDWEDARPGIRAYRVGKGRLYVAHAAGKIPDYLTKVVTVLDVVAKAQLSSRPLRGWDGKGDGRYVTDFPSGRLVFDTRNLSIVFIPQRR